jgi:DNA-binding HxlR family transcriptional regulator
MSRTKMDLEPGAAMCDGTSAGDGECEIKFCCSVDVTLSVIGGKWKLLIYSHLWNGVTRFGQLKRAIPHITQTMLTQQLRELERDGIVTRTIYAEIPPRVEYALTEFGRTLESVITPMHEWGVTYVSRVIEQKQSVARAEREATEAALAAAEA